MGKLLLLLLSTSMQVFCVVQFCAEDYSLVQQHPDNMRQLPSYLRLLSLLFEELSVSFMPTKITCRDSSVRYFRVVLRTRHH